MRGRHEKVGRNCRSRGPARLRVGSPNERDSLTVTGRHSATGRSDGILASAPELGSRVPGRSPCNLFTGRRGGKGLFGDVPIEPLQQVFQRLLEFIGRVVFG